jgi:ornithine cyclodeaminase/alanine dehydrogenase
MWNPERGRQILYLSRAQIEALEFSLDDVIAAVEAGFQEKAAGRVEMPPKPGIHTRPDAFIHAMPAYLAGVGAAGLKWVSGYPENRPVGLPYITGLLILNCPETGRATPGHHWRGRSGSGQCGFTSAGLDAGAKASGI